ncbi:hypothetical protein PoB_004057000 [Plakobranchus ocellatus]|uniref:Uncharacterized protein n=1 Tax=Plakobranchus ocellatus TaxID=259542 RepID=A0AAV4B0D4_9GAST|nr:hypothetical protein PoB_004057000 [Plakobranchus ocellatus]
MAEDLLSNAWLLCTTSPQQGHLTLSGLSSGQGACVEARTRDRRFPADLSMGSLFTVPPTPANYNASIACYIVMAVAK